MECLESEEELKGGERGGRGGEEGRGVLGLVFGGFKI